jgi:hypothetical protein
MAKQKLTASVDEFSSAMLKRLREKQRQGFTGWDKSEFKALKLHRRLHEKATDVIEKGENSDPRDLIDIANFAMMLYKRLNNTKTRIVRG